MNIAEYFNKLDENRVNNLEVLPPYEQGKEKLNQWVRGTIRYKTKTDVYRELVVTGPKMRVCFSGCKWNRVVFAMPKEGEECDPSVKQFRNWLATVVKRVKDTVWESPETYKPGCKINSRFTFDDPVKPSSDPDKYPEELRCRLSTVRREMTAAEREENANDAFFDQSSDHIETVDADLFTITDGNKVPVDPTTVMSHSYMIPVLRIAYSRHGDRFGLVLTITKAQYFPSEFHPMKVQNADWVMDVPTALEPTEDDEPDNKRTKVDF